MAGAAAVLGALVPATALAEPTRISRAGFTDHSFLLTAAPGTTNAIGVSHQPDPDGGFDYVFTDPAGLITGLYITCDRLEGTEIRCKAPSTIEGELDSASLKIDAGDGNDTVTVAQGATAPPPSVGQRIYGGPGADSLSASFHSGGQRNTLVSGDAGNDRLSSAGGASLQGLGGIDKIFARNGVRDSQINCGPGKDKKESAKRDKKDAQAVSC
jgi:Ca2+-binding RTX toxin-like protein